MSGLDRDALDRYITDGRYSRELILVTCDQCENIAQVTAESEFGATDWLPEECPKCKTAWTGDEKWDYDGPDEDAAYERARDF